MRMTTWCQSEWRDKSDGGNVGTMIMVQGAMIKTTMETTKASVNMATTKNKLLTRGERREAGYCTGIACSCLSTTGGLYTGQGLTL